MTALVLVTLTFFFSLVIATATAKGGRTNPSAAGGRVLSHTRMSQPLSNSRLLAFRRTSRSPIAMTERGSAVLVWLEQNPRPGTAASRRAVRRHAQGRVWRGLRLAGVLPGFRCLHSHEGAWNSNTGNGYWGGLQMDGGFQSTYGREYIRAFHGSANRWPVWAQLVAGYRAFHGYHGHGARGWSPWGTRGLCGL